MTDPIKKLSTPMMDALLFLYNNISSCADGVERPTPARQTINALFNRGLLELNSDSIIIPNALGLEVLALRFPLIEEGIIPDEEWEKIAPELYAKIAEGEASSTEQTQQNSVLPLNMYIRFVEIIHSDLDRLLKHVHDSVYFRPNLLMAWGFVSNIHLAYSDKNCPSFLLLLAGLEQGFRQHKAPLHEMEKVLQGMLKLTEEALNGEGRDE
ncbi:MAG: hypothetical protein ACXWT1_05775 [Methylobacter sp.]